MKYSFKMNKRLNEMAIITARELKITKNDFIVYSIQRTKDYQSSSMPLPPHVCGVENDELIQVNLTIPATIQDYCSPHRVRRAIWHTICLHRTGQILSDRQALLSVCEVVTGELDHDPYCRCQICDIIAKAMEHIDIKIA